MRKVRVPPIILMMKGNLCFQSHINKLHHPEIIIIFVQSALVKYEIKKAPAHGTRKDFQKTSLMPTEEVLPSNNMTYDSTS